MKNNTVILAPHSYVVVHRKQPNIYDVYDIETGECILSRTSPDNILRIFSEWCCTFKFIDENIGEVYEGKEISDAEQKQSKPWNRGANDAEVHSSACINQEVKQDEKRKRF